jgi:hypothetical protein
MVSTSHQRRTDSPCLRTRAYPWCAQYGSRFGAVFDCRHRTQTCVTRLGNTAGLPVPMSYLNQEKAKPSVQPVQQQPLAKDNMIAAGGNRNANNMASGPKGRLWSFKLFDHEGNKKTCECSSVRSAYGRCPLTTTETFPRSTCVVCSLFHLWRGQETLRPPGCIRYPGSQERRRRLILG